jgi:FixJ family two-component response regulator
MIAGSLKRTKVYVVDDDEALRDALASLLESAGHTVVKCARAEDFLNVCKPGGVGCAILDVDLPGMDGLALHREFIRRGCCQLPVIFLTGHGTIPASVQAIKSGALDFLTKPVDGALLLARVQDALERSRYLQKKAADEQSEVSRLTGLSRREREIMMMAVAGLTSKEIAAKLSISHRTVDVHRANIILKTGAANWIELAELAKGHAPQ